MKKSVLLLLLTLAFNAYAQDSKPDVQEIKAVVNQFFEALEKRDSTLMKNAMMTDGQIWRISGKETPGSFDMRFVKDDVSKLGALPPVKEIALDFDIKVHNNIAVAWVPYEFHVNNKFSHCGIDVFVLFKVEDSWKIESTAYSIENNCDELKGKNEQPHAHRGRQLMSR